MRPARQKDVETLLTREARERLPWLLLVRLYLDPGSLFKDATRGPARERERALSYNRRMRWMLLTYLQRWTVIAGVFFLGIAPAEAASPIPAAAFAVGCSISLIVIGCTALAYVLLGARD
jgi:hypothetical protein